jgi:ABC-type branched-subunit amino acid transport system ATPase component/ABC-type branched-subunit amino acid transport system permease subunit
MGLGTLVLGLINGATIGLLAAGFVLVYKSNRFLNLAHAQLGAVSAMLLAKLCIDGGWNFWPALAVCLLLGVGVGLLVERFVIAPVRRKTSSPIRLLLLSVGISQLLLALTYIPGLLPSGGGSVGFPQPFDANVEVGGVVLDGMSVLTLVLVPVLLVALTVFLQRSSFGRQIRAAANNPQAARLCGVSTRRVSLMTWGIAGGLSATSAVLSGPSSVGSSFAAVGPSLLVLTLGAAAFGAFVSIPWAVGGGVGLGVVNQVVLERTRDAGQAQLAVFGVILIVILVRGRAIDRVFAVAGAAVPERPLLRMPTVLQNSGLYRHAHRWLGLAALAVAVVLPQLPYLREESNRFLLVLLLVYALVGVALTMLIGWAGQVSLGHFAIVGLGAFLAARYIDAGYTLLAVLVLVGLLSALATVVVGLPALRVRGLTLAVTTLGFAVLAPEWLFLQKKVGGDTPFTTPVDFPDIGGGLGQVTSQAQVYYLALGFLALTVLATSALRRSSAGRTILAVRDNERAIAALGVTPSTNKLAILALSGFLAGVAGVFWAITWQRVSPTQFSPDLSQAVLALPVVGGLGSVVGAIVAAIFIYGPTLFLAPHLVPLLGDFGKNAGFLLAVGGLGMVGVMMQFPNGIAGFAQEKWQALLDRRALSAGARRAAPEGSADADHVMEGAAAAHIGTEVAAPASRRPDAGDVALTVRGAAISFGGIKALDGADLTIREHEIVGLIGPNGAGKTTLMNVVSGTLSPDAGSVTVFGHEVVDLPADVRSAYGLARSFQDASLFAGLTVAETVQLGVERGTKTGMVGALVGAPWVRGANDESRMRAEEILESFGLGPWADVLTSSLSTGTRRICDLATQVAARPKLLLLDEPTAGVAQREAEAFGPLVRRIRDELDCAIVLVEHDMPLLMGLCDRVYAMEAGRVIAEGTPDEIRANPRVISSYLGSEQSAIERSGSVGQEAGPTHSHPAAATQARSTS